MEPEPDSASKTLYAALPPLLATLNVAAVPSVVAEPSSVKKKFGPVAGGLPSETVILPRIEMFGILVVFPRVIN